MPQRAPPPWARVAPCLLLAAGLLALLRFWGLGRWGLWVDEAHTLHDALWLSRDGLPDNPLGYLITNFVVQFLGSTDEVALRLGPAFFGAIGIPQRWHCRVAASLSTPRPAARAAKSTR